jgi:hypothetical protein
MFTRDSFVGKKVTVMGLGLNDGGVGRSVFCLKWGEGNSGNRSENQGRASSFLGSAEGYSGNTLCAW